MKRLLLFVLLLAASFSWAQEKKPLCIYGFNPFHVSEENLGIAFSYERFVDSKGIFSLYVPISIAFPEVERNNFYNTYYTTQYTDSRNLTYFNAYPGIKIYPGGSNKRVSYAVGASPLRLWHPLVRPHRAINARSHRPPRHGVDHPHGISEDAAVHARRGHPGI